MAAITVECRSARECEGLGEALAGVLRAGDLVILQGALGAGKTTLVRGLAAGLGVAGPVSSPTFVIARTHPPTGVGPGLIHVDAYRLDSAGELDSLDIDADLDSSVMAVEWGSGRAEQMSRSRLVVELRRDEDVSGSPGAEGLRVVSLRPQGPNWDEARVGELRRCMRLFTSG